MAGRPAKTLLAHVKEGTFRAQRHAHLLAGPDLPFAGFALLQQRYRAAAGEVERRAVPLEFERAIKLSHAELSRELAAGNGHSLDAELAKLGKTGSIQQLQRFFPHSFVHPRGRRIGQPFTLEPFQKQFLREFYKRDKRGRRVYRLGVLGLPRGNGKTPLAAGLGLYELVTRTDAPQIYCAACSKDQARIALGFAREFAANGPLAEWVSGKNTLTCSARNGSMQVVSSEGRLQFGLAPSVAVIDELWAVFSVAA